MIFITLLWWDGGIFSSLITGVCEDFDDDDDDDDGCDGDDGGGDDGCDLEGLAPTPKPVSYTHLTLPTNREV